GISTEELRTICREQRCTNLDWQCVTFDDDEDAVVKLVECCAQLEILRLPMRMDLSVGRDDERVSMSDEVPPFALFALPFEYSKTDGKVVRRSADRERQHLRPLGTGGARIVLKPAFKPVEGLQSISHRVVSICKWHDGAVKPSVEDGVK